jgi:putative FmdB family regulatory protein
VPIYEYVCPDCGHEFETIQKVSEPKLTDCPSCPGEKLRKKVSLSSFSLKGSGWYKDHYGLKDTSSAKDSGGGGKESSSASESASTSDGGGGGSTNDAGGTSGPASGSGSSASTPTASTSPSPSSGSKASE